MAEGETTAFDKLIEAEVDKRREVLLRLVDQACNCYRRKYENILDDVSIEKAVEEIDFQRDVLSKVAPIAEKKVASQLRNAMRLESEFREITPQTETNHVPGDNDYEFVVDPPTADPQRVSAVGSGAVPKRIKHEQTSGVIGHASGMKSGSSAVRSGVSGSNSSASPSLQHDFANRFLPFQGVSVRRASSPPPLLPEIDVAGSVDGGVEVEIVSRHCSDLTATDEFIVIADNKAIGFYNVDERNTSVTPIATLPVSKKPEVVKMLSKSSLLFGAYEDETVQYIFQIILLTFDIDTGVTREQILLAAPGIACVASTFDGQLVGNENLFFVVQADGMLHLFKGETSLPVMSQNCFSVNVYDSDATSNGSQQSLVTSCFEHLSYIEIVVVNHRDNTATLFQQIMVDKPKRVLLLNRQTILIGSFPDNTAGCVVVLNRASDSSQTRFQITKNVNTFSCSPRLDNIWGLGLMRNKVAIMHKKSANGKARVTIIPSNELL